MYKEAFNIIPAGFLFYPIVLEDQEVFKIQLRYIKSCLDKCIFPVAESAWACTEYHLQSISYPCAGKKKNKLYLGLLTFNGGGGGEQIVNGKHYHSKWCS